MYPVNDIPFAIITYDDVGWIEIAVAELGMLGHSVQSGHQLIACAVVQLLHGFEGADGFFLQFV